MLNEFKAFISRGNVIDRLATLGKKKEEAAPDAPPAPTEAELLQAILVELKSKA